MGNKKLFREPQLLKTKVSPVSENVKIKVKNAIQDIVNRIKDRHL